MLPIVLGSVLLAAFVVLFVFRARLGRPVPIPGGTPDGAPDTTGSYGRPRLAVGLGLVFVAIGVAMVAGPWRSDVGRYGPLWLGGLALVLAGGAFTVISILQLLRRRRAASAPRA